MSNLKSTDCRWLGQKMTTNQCREKHPYYETMERNGSMDLLKCLCMLFVVIIHLMGHSGYLTALNKGTMVYYGANYVLSLIRVAVPVFVLITGYFGVSFKLEKVATMEITLLFYSLFTFIIALVFAGGGY